MKLDWKSDQPILLVNPKLPDWQRQLTEQHGQAILQQGPYIWLQSSGTTSSSPYSMKWVGLTRESLLNSADSVNAWIQSDANDIWLQSLPVFHVGGLSILARSFLSGAQVVEFTEKWNPGEFCRRILENKVTVCSLVPTQVHDLVEQEFQCPECLRIVFVGGGQLSESLFHRFKKMGWPVLLTYGMTEAASQIATSPTEVLQSTEYPKVEKLPHIQWRVDSEATLWIQGSSLASQIAILEGNSVSFENPQIAGEYETSDKVQLSEDKQSLLEVTRKNRVIKISGELVDLDQLQEWANEVTGEIFKVAVVKRSHVRIGYEILIAVEGFNPQLNYAHWLNLLKKKFPRYIKILGVFHLESFPRSSLGKLLFNDIEYKISGTRFKE